MPVSLQTGIKSHLVSVSHLSMNNEFLFYVNGCMDACNKAMRVSAQGHMSLQEHVPCLSPIFPKDSYEECSLLYVYFTILSSLR
jgi:hypothetical protein